MRYTHRVNLIYFIVCPGEIRRNQLSLSETPKKLGASELSPKWTWDLLIGKKAKMGHLI